MHRGFGHKLFRDSKVNPVLWLFREGMNDWDSKLVAGDNLLEILLSALLISD